MNVFLTGATGFIGSHLTPELIGAGHRVTGLSRSETGSDALKRAGADCIRGDLADLDLVAAAAGGADAVIHAAFDHDFSRLKENSERDRSVIEALGRALAGSDRPLIIASGTGLARRQGDRPAMETDPAMTADEFPRGATEEAADAVADRGGRVAVVRLAQVHDTRHQGRLAEHVKLAREKGFVAYVGEGENRLAAVHVSDAVRLIRLVLERCVAGARYHAVAEEGVPFRAAAEAIGLRLGLPVRSIASDEAADYFGWLEQLAQADLAASSAWTRQVLDWSHSGPDLATDLRARDADGPEPDRASG